MIRPIKTYEVSVQGFPPVNYSARSRGKAIASAWRDYTHAYDVNFGKFIQIARARVITDPPGVGRRVLIAGQPATVVIGYGQYVHFMRDDSDVILCSHPADVAAMSSEPA